MEVERKKIEKYNGLEVRRVATLLSEYKKHNKLID